MIALLPAALLAAPPQLTPELLRARYAGIRSLSADVTQTKEGRYWARPLTSRIRLRYTPERITWETLSPVPSTVVIEGEKLTVRSGAGAPRDLGAAASDPRVAALLRFLRALLALDLGVIERDFALEYGAGELLARPRAGSDLSFLTALRLRFDPRAELAGLDIETASERTRLAFDRVERDPPAGPAP